MKPDVILALSLCLGLGACATSPKESEATPEPALTPAENIAAGDAAYSRGDLESAQVKYLVALSEDPENPQTLYRIGSIYMAQEQYDLAKESFQGVLQLQADHLDASESLGLLLLKEGKDLEAQRLLKRVVVQDQTRWRSLNGLGVIYDVQKLHPQAQSLYRMALRYNTRSAKIHNNLGYSYYLNGQWDDALREYHTAVELDPDYREAWSNIGLYYVKLGEFSDALAAFEEINTSPQAANNVGYLSLLQGNYTEAERYFELAIKLSPSYYKVAHDNLAYVRKQRSR